MVFDGEKSKAMIKKATLGKYGHIYNTVYFLVS